MTKAIAESMGLKDAGGALVAEAEPQSPAAKAGLKSGDVITSINGEVVKDPRDLARRIAAISPDTTISIEYVRGGEAKTVHATVTPMQQIAGHGPGRHNSGRPQDGGNASMLGMTVARRPR